ncbi:MAG: TonB-dependent receptor [Deltaproteobacteria bacterium]|nr:TonB-dependent receptor [Deltaproteobacteria bacterium]
MTRVLAAAWAAACLCVYAAPARADSATGVLRGVVFAEAGGSPLVGMRVAVVGGGAVTTNADGAFRVESAAGELTVVVGGPGFPEVRVEAVPVVAGQVTELLVTLRPDGSSPRVAIEAAGPVATAESGAPELDQRPRGRIVGTVTDTERGQPIAGARVLVRGHGAEARAGADGRFVLAVPVGTWDVTVIHPEFSSRTVAALDVVEGQDTELAIDLTPAALRLDDFVVSAPRIEGGTNALLEERRQSAAVADILGAEQMSRSGDSDAAAALRRVTGVTLVDGKFVYVRGLGERYSSTLLDGAQLPSPDPERRVVPLDLFPTDVLESIVIQKTWTPDMPGEFGGGVVSLRTRRWPAHLEGSIGLSAGFLSGTTFTQGRAGPRGPTDWLGVDGGTRALPDDVRAASQKSALLEGDRFSELGYSPEELEAFGESLDNDWTLTPRRVPPDIGVSAQLGSGFEAASVSGGFRLALLYDNAWQDIPWHARFLKPKDLVPIADYAVEDLTQTVSLGGILAAGLDFGEAHHVSSTTMLTRLTDNEVRTYEGFNNDVGTDIRVTRLRWVERMLLSENLSGEHTVGRTTVGWHYAFALATRLEPDRKQVRYDFEKPSGPWLLSSGADGNKRLFGDLDDRVHDLGVDVTLALPMRGEREARLRSGAAFHHKQRVVDSRRFYFAPRGPLATDPAVKALPPGELFSPAYIGLDGFQLNENTQATDSYTASHVIAAAYLMAEVPVLPRLTLTGGLRLEHSDQQLETFVRFSATKERIRASLKTLDLLPALLATWAFRDDMQLRLAFSRTVSRPDLRELSPATFDDITGGKEVRGNPELARALITHLDARWEWYPSAGESLSVAVFYKQFKDPIEEVVILGTQLLQSYANVPSARNLGIELELRKSLAFFTPKLRDLSVAANVSFIWSRVQTPKDLVTVSQTGPRPLQGQSPYVLNVQLGYDNADTGTSASLLYNVVGPAIAEATGYEADIEDQPIHQLDLVASQALGRGFAVKLKLSNLLGQSARQRQGGVLTEERPRGRRLAVGLEKSF